MPTAPASSEPVAARLLVAIVALAFAVAGCASDDSPPAVLTADTLVAAEMDTPVLAVEVLETVPHRPDAFTQGLVLDGDRMFESTGRRGRSELAELDPATGEVRRRVPLGDEYYGEGLALVGDRLVQLTWQENTAFVWDADTFEPLGRHTYDGEGWGLCHDGERLVMSDGSATLTFRDPDTFERTGEVSVSLDGEPVRQLNELACVQDRVYANVWMTERIVRIDPATGDVDAVIDAAPLLDLLDPAPTHEQAVLNGITHDPRDDTFWLTGKLWPQMFRVRLAPSEG
jgi:glutaminyl-peptide cyclotransferase